MLTLKAQQIARRSSLRHYSLAGVTSRTSTSRRSTMSDHHPPQAHYEAHSAESYEQAFFYEPGVYTERLCSLVRARLQLTVNNAVVVDADPLPPPRRRRRLLDIGGGTGNFTRMLIKDTKLSAIVVDPFLEQSQCGETDTSGENVLFVAEPAEAFMETMFNEDGANNDESKNWWKRNYDYVLMKEVAHHFADQDRTAIFRGMWQGLRSTSDKNGGPPSLLLITRPQHDIDYPLWDQARQVWADNQPSLETLVEQLRDAGFQDIQHTIEAYPCVVGLERWQAMVKARFWSTFSHFSDEQLLEACDKIAQNEQHRIKDGVIEFEDRLLFVSAKKLDV